MQLIQIQRDQFPPFGIILAVMSQPKKNTFLQAKSLSVSLGTWSPHYLKLSQPVEEYSPANISKCCVKIMRTIQTTYLFTTPSLQWTEDINVESCFENNFLFLLNIWLTVQT